MLVVFVRILFYTPPPPTTFRKYFDSQRIGSIFALISCIVCSPTNVLLQSYSSNPNKGMKLIIISWQIFALVCVAVTTFMNTDPFLSVICTEKYMYFKKFIMQYSRW